VPYEELILGTKATSALDDQGTWTLRIKITPPRPSLQGVRKGDKGGSKEG